jgi:hypothetical protein
MPIFPKIDIIPNKQNPVALLWLVLGSKRSRMQPMKTTVTTLAFNAI